MKYKVKLTILDKKVYPELKAAYCAALQAGTIPLRTAANGKPPILSNGEPMVSTARP
ncbi:MAG: hypothetical protein HFF19_03840 [Oscillospiraceae bacterium]|nr:hypothetical protein [Oscillospiraceae bacterium]